MYLTGMFRAFFTPVYVATSGTVTPGPANSKVVFTINYY
jgi:type 1 fimbria pilin